MACGCHDLISGQALAFAKDNQCLKYLACFKDARDLMAGQPLYPYSDPLMIPVAIPHQVMITDIVSLALSVGLPHTVSHGGLALAVVILCRFSAALA